jgi:hypothetical protein
VIISVVCLFVCLFVGFFSIPWFRFVVLFRLFYSVLYLLLFYSVVSFHLFSLVLLAIFACLSFVDVVAKLWYVKR